MILNLILLLMGFVFLGLGGNFIVDGSVALAEKFKVRPLIIGLTVVAFGTSIPELFVTMVSASEKAGELAFADIIGSNIANTLLVLGLAALICEIPAKKTIVRKNINFLLISGLLFWILSDKIIFGKNMIELNRFGGSVLLVIFIYFVFTLIQFNKEKKIDKLDLEYRSIEKDYQKKALENFGIPAGLVLLFLGARFVVDNSLAIANLYNLSEGFIGVTILSLGTSLPEIATILVAGIKNQNEVILGNIIGSNIFNLTFVLGLAGITFGISATSYIRIDIAFLIFATVLLCIFVFLNKEIKKSNAILMLFFYAIYLSYVFVRG